MPRTATHVSKKTQSGMTLQELFLTKLKALYDVENQLVKALPKMAKKAADPDLRRGFEKHEKQTEGHVERLERIFDMLEARPQKLQSDAIRGITADADWVIKNVKGEAALDAALVGAAQYAEHYEIAGYESAIAWARLLEQGEAADILEETLTEEQETSRELTELAESKIDERAMEGAEDASDADEKDKDEEEDDSDLDLDEEGDDEEEEEDEAA